jgi:hypothetical protein
MLATEYERNEEPVPDGRDEGFGAVARPQGWDTRCTRG